MNDDDRTYVASEITAFLFYFLTRLQCPALNRPTAHCLTVPSWGRMQCMHVRRQAGIATRAWLARLGGHVLGTVTDDPALGIG